MFPSSAMMKVNTAAALPPHEALGSALTAQALGPGTTGDTYTLTSTDGVITRTCSGSVVGCPHGTW